jgi:hypothetical protein
MTAEEYREVAGFPGYTVSNWGNVYGPKGLLKPTPNNCGYLRVALSTKTQTVLIMNRLTLSGCRGTRTDGTLLRWAR